MGSSGPWRRSDAGLTVVLVRHGRTAWNAQRRFLGRTDVPLDAVGRGEAEVLASCVPEPFDQVYTSPLARARQTAEYLQAEPVVIEGLAELHQGDLEGLAFPEALARHEDFFQDWVADPENAIVPGGECYGVCRTRALEALGGIRRRHRAGDLVAVVTHQMVIAAITCTTGAQPLTSWRDHRVRNASATVLSWSGDRWCLETHDWHPDDPRA